jgi:phage terminase small subunit
MLTESRSWPQDFVMGKLRNPRRERFAVEVASMVPVDRAYLAAGFRSKPEWARPNGSKLAHEPSVAARIAELQNEFKSSAALHVQYLQSLLLPAAEANLADFVSDDGTDGPRFKKLSELTRTQAAAIQAISFGDDGAVTDVKLVPKTEAVKALLTSIGATGVQKHEHSVTGLGDRLDLALKRARLSYDDTKVLLEVVESLPSEADRDAQEGPSPNDDVWP